MMLNPQVCLIPLYKLLTALKLRNTYWALIIPYTTFRLPFEYPFGKDVFSLYTKGD